MMKNLKMLLTAIALSIVHSAYGQGLGALSDTTSGITPYLPYIKGICYALAGSVCIIGSVVIFIQMNNDNPQIRQKIVGLVGSCLFFIVSAEALPMFFGYDSDGCFFGSASWSTGSSSDGSSSGSEGSDITGGGLYTVTLPDGSTATIRAPQGGGPPPSQVDPPPVPSIGPPRPPQQDDEQ